MASSKREKELARQRAERQAARRAASAQRKRQRTAVIASVVAVALIATAAIAGALALRDDSADPDTLATPTSAPLTAAPSAASSPAASAKPSAAASAAATKAPGGDPGCEYIKTEDPGSKDVALPPTEGVETEQPFAVTIATDRGDIVFDLDTAAAPCTANSLRSLAHFTYFDDTSCHRLTTQGIQVLQCGDPTGTGTGGPGYAFANENLEQFGDASAVTYPRGTVAMANGGPDTNGSQFFLVYGDSSLPPNYTPFGTITKGLDILDKVAEGGSDDSRGAGDGKPLTPIKIETLRVKPQTA